MVLVECQEGAGSCALGKGWVGGAQQDDVVFLLAEVAAEARG